MQNEAQKPSGIVAPISLNTFLRDSGFPRSTTMWLLAQPDIKIRPAFFKMGRRWYITVEDANRFIAELAAEGYTPRTKSRRSTKVVRKKGGAA